MLYFRMPALPPAGGWPAAALQPHIGSQSFLQPHIGSQSLLQPHIRGRSALQPHIGSRSFLQPHIRGHDAGDDGDDADAARREALEASYAWPWFGTDGDWADYGPAAMQAQALLKVRTRILRPEDPRVTAARQLGTPRNLPAPRGAGAAARAAALWRWQPPFRVMAVVAELSSRLRVQQGRVHWVHEPAAGKGLVAAPVFELLPRPANFDCALQIDKVLRAAVERQDRLAEILSQADEIGPFFEAIVGVDRSLAPRLGELLDAAWEAATLVVMALKNEVAELRPFQRSDAVLPMLTTPGHGSLPSGHATMATLASELLIALRYAGDPDRCAQLDQLARRIAFNRVVAGVHFPMDSHVGYALGRQLAATLVAAARGGPLPKVVPLRVERDSTLEEAGERPGDLPPDRTQRIRHLAQWPLLWQAAEAELIQLRV